MAIEKADFYTIFQKEGEHFYDKLYSLDQDKFNDWVANNFIEIKTINTFEEVVPTKKCIKEFLNKGYKHLESQCHYSAKAISLLNPRYEYWTGFIHRQDFYNCIITHSFNLFAKSIVDFARINKQLKILDIENPYFPHVYYGINIPIEFLRKFKKETFIDCSMKPLLFEWFKENNCC